MNENACKWVSAPNAMTFFGTGRSDPSTWMKTASCPVGYVMTGTRMFGIAYGLDEEHVDAYCCPFS
ncbi:TPA: shufflon protein C' [Salmonella enterica]|nr:shufflon protein C' [Salmonella enterica]